MVDFLFADAAAEEDEDHWFFRTPFRGQDLPSDATIGDSRAFRSLAERERGRTVAIILGHLFPDRAAWEPQGHHEPRTRRSGKSQQGQRLIITA